MDCIGDSHTMKRFQKKLQSHLEQQQILDQQLSLTLALFGNDKTVSDVLQKATQMFPINLRLSKFKSLKADISQFSKKVDFFLTKDYVEDNSIENITPLIILDNFTTANPTSVSMLHQAWERERPLIRYQGNAYDLSSYIWLVAFRGEDLAENIRKNGNDWKTPLLKHWSSFLTKKENNNKLNPSAAIGRMSGGFILDAVSKDFVTPSRCIDNTITETKHPFTNNVFIVGPLLLLIFFILFSSSSKVSGSGSRSSITSPTPTPTPTTSSRSRSRSRQNENMQHQQGEGKDATKTSPKESRRIKLRKNSKRK
jgi:hypothetical protein